jgi:transposase-like protein
MSGVQDLLLYPLATGDQPVCPKCCSPLVLVSFQSERGMPDFSRFRCPDCGQSETFADDDGKPLPITART